MTRVHVCDPAVRDELALTVPALSGIRPVQGSYPTVLYDVTGAPVARAGSVGRLVQFHMAERAGALSPVLRGVDDDSWFGLFSRAGRWLLDALHTDTTDETTPEVAALTAATSAVTGLPLARVRHGLASVADELLRLAQILTAQSPDGGLAVYRTGVVAGRDWQWRPAGRSLYVRVPGNFPTITIEWVQALAARRPVLLGTTGDPFTSYLLASALYRAGLPDGALSLCHGDSSTLLRLADQVLWPGDAPDGLGCATVKTYHSGRSKAVLTAAGSDDTYRRLARVAARGCGRLCTNLSALAVIRDAADAARRLAAQLSEPVLPLVDPVANVPAFPDRRERDAIAERIEREIAAGALDVTAEVTGSPLRVDADGAAFLRPTVLLVDVDCPLWGAELPFPFVAVAQVPRSRLREACTGSLIVALPDSDPALVAQFADDHGVDKVFAGEAFDHGYDPAEPHEGYLADFLFRKKPVRGCDPEETL